MRSIMLRLVIGVAITAIGMFGADSSLGTWKLNVAKSKTTGSNPAKSRTEVREATPDGGVTVTSTRQMADGTTMNFSYSYKYDGKEYPVTGGPFDTISSKRVDANTTTAEVINKANGTYHQTTRSVISKDGKTWTMNAKGTDTKGKPITATNVFEKQ
jgi:glucose/arabinose dehydrogenase